MNQTTISTKKRWVATDGWRGYEEPIYWVAGANDTGMYSDSPCPSDVAQKELGYIKSALRQAGIRFKSTTARSSNVFMIKHYIVVAPADFDKAKAIALEHYNGALKADTDLLYVNHN